MMPGLGRTRNKNIAASRAARFAKDRRIPAAVSAGGAPGKRYRDLVLSHWLLGKNGDRVAAIAGDRGYKILALLIVGHPLGRTRREAKGAATKLISRTFAVSPQAARAARRKLACDLLASNDPVARALCYSDILAWLMPARPRRK